jgi:tubulin polyglutamylase TTLL4
VVGKKTKINKKEGYLASKYLSKPHLINGLKYDLRVYVLVSSYDPLRIYVYNDGLARFATEQYSLNPNDLKKKFIHLTNFSVNKKSENFIQNKNFNQPPASNNSAPTDSASSEESSSKWSFKQLRASFDQRNINFDYVFA